MEIFTDTLILDTLSIGLESEFIRLESTYWYKYDKTNDSYTRVKDSEWLEELFQEEKL